MAQIATDGLSGRGQIRMKKISKADIDYNCLGARSGFVAINTYATLD